VLQGCGAAGQADLVARGGYQQDWFRPAFLCLSRAALGPDGLPVAIQHRLVAPTILAPVSPTPIKPGMVVELAVEGLVRHSYKVPSRRTDYHLLELPIPTMVLRTTGHGPNNFALESLIAELAHAAGSADPYQYRRRLLADNPAALAVLNRAAALANWGKARPGRFLGIAFAHCFGSYLCQVIELSIADEAIRLHRIVSVCDPGRALDPHQRHIADRSRRGLGAVRRPLLLNYVCQQPRARNQPRSLPRRDIAGHTRAGHRVSGEPPKTLGGLGEVGPVCVPAALCNALFAATRRRHSRLPLARDSVFTFYGKRRVTPERGAASHGAVRFHCQRLAGHRRCRSVDAAVVGAAGPSGIDRDKIRLRRRPLCGACTVHVNEEAVRSCAYTIDSVQDARVTTSKTLEGQPSRASARMDRASGAAMWLLPAGLHHGGCRVAGKGPATDRLRHRGIDHQHLPLRHLRPGQKGGGRGFGRLTRGLRN
jgi:hypothetical protein